MEAVSVRTPPLPDSEFCLGIALQHVPDLHIPSSYFFGLKVSFVSRCVAKSAARASTWLAAISKPLAAFIQSSSSPF